MEGSVVEIQNIVTRFGNNEIHKGISLSIPKSKVVALIGGSGAGKSVLLREILALQKPTSGTVKVLGTDMHSGNPEEILGVRERIGVLFQNGALFSGLTVGQNISVPLIEHGGFSNFSISEIIKLRLALAGLAPNAESLMPSELSGGMRKRAALARALALEPELLFLDEPTSGLDPINARAFDELVRVLCDSLGLSIVLVTHDMDTLNSICDCIIALADGKVIAKGTLSEVQRTDHPWIKEYFSTKQAEQGHRVN